jgi:hypothetical protein
MWKTAITDVQRIENSTNFLVLACATKGEYFGASAVFVFDLTARDPLVQVKVPLTPWSWVSMAQNCAGNNLILTGAEYMHHTWNNGVLTEHPQDIAFRSGRLWRASGARALYCDGNRVVSIETSLTQAETFQGIPDLNYVHGIEPHLQVAGGDSGTLLTNRGQGWNNIDDVPTLGNLVDINCVNEHEIYLCAGYGGVFRWNGDSDWFHYDTESSLFMRTTCSYHGAIYASSLKQKNYVLTRTQAIPVPEAKFALRFVTDGDLLFGLGLGKFEVFDGTSWRMYELDLYKLFPQELEAMYAAAPGP